MGARCNERWRLHLSGLRRLHLPPRSLRWAGAKPRMRRLRPALQCCVLARADALDRAHRSPQQLARGYVSEGAGMSRLSQRLHKAIIVHCGLTVTDAARQLQIARPALSNV